MKAVLTPLPTATRYPDSAGELLEVYGYGAPLWLADPTTEYETVRHAVGLIDFSMLYKVDVQGAGALDVANRVVCRNLRRVPHGRIAYGPIVDERGMMVDDCTAIVFSPEHVRVTGGSPADERILREASSGTGLTVCERRQELVHLCLQGPESRRVLQRLTNADLSNEAFSYYEWRAGIVLAGIRVHLNRLGFTGELGYEIWAPRERALELWDVLVESDARGFGAAALMSLRTEVGYVMGDGVDYDNSITPYECGLGWAVDLGKPDFRGREALARAEKTVRRTLVSVIVDADPDSASGAALEHDGAIVGALHMAVPSPQLGGRTLSLAHVDLTAAEPGTTLKAVMGDQHVAAEVVPTPVYDSERTRVRG